MSSTPVELKFTYEDFLLFSDNGKRHELIDGDHWMTPAPSTRHQRISGRILTILQNFLDRQRLGEVFAAPCDVVLSEVDVVEPDILFVAKSRQSIITEHHIQGPPDLIVEILSATTRKNDEIVKRKLYERSAVQEYWIVDPELDQVKVYRLVEDRYTQPVLLVRELNEILTSPLFPDLGIPLESLFN